MAGLYHIRIGGWVLNGDRMVNADQLAIEPPPATGLMLERHKGVTDHFLLPLFHYGQTANVAG